MREVKKGTKGRQSGKRRGKRRRSPFLGIFIFILLAAAGAFVSVMIFFRVQNIEVRGTSKYSSRQIIEASGVADGRNLLSVNAEKTSAALCEKLPYIKSADIALRPLSTVIITVTKDTPCGALVSGDSYLLVDSQLKLLEIRQGAGKVKGLPLIRGFTAKSPVPGKKIVGGNQNTTDILVDIYGAFKDNKIDPAKVTEINVADSYELQLRYDNRINIVLGTGSYLSYKLKAAMYIINTQLAKTAKGKLDVSSEAPNASDKPKIFFDPDNS
ncbi:MAG: FtsQ-type POTRA domain-containing protein [Clostridia bacterium]|nr:FtsQ-type POTRA domain-containing protein [Clostridia bacterium]